MCARRAEDSEAREQWACPRCHRIVERLEEAELLDVLTFERVVGCSECLDAIERALDALTVLSARRPLTIEPRRIRGVAA